MTYHGILKFYSEISGFPVLRHALDIPIDSMHANDIHYNSREKNILLDHSECSSKNCAKLLRLIASFHSKFRESTQSTIE